MSAVKLDDIDRRILDILQRDGRIANSRLAAEVGISPPAMLERVKRLERAGVITGYVALVDAKKLDQHTCALVSVSLDVHRYQALHRFKEEIRELEEVLACYHVTGAADFVLRIMVRDIREYERFLVEKLTRIQGIQKIETSFVLSTVQERTRISVAERREADDLPGDSERPGEGDRPAQR